MQSRYYFNPETHRGVLRLNFDAPAKPCEVALLVDVSASMHLTLPRIIPALKLFVGSRPSCAFKLAAFDDRMTLYRPGRPPVELGDLAEVSEWIAYRTPEELSELDQRIAELKPRGDTALVSAVDAAVRAAPPKSTVVVFTDGESNAGLGVERCLEIGERARAKQVKIVAVVPESEYHFAGVADLRDLLLDSGQLVQEHIDRIETGFEAIRLPVDFEVVVRVADADVLPIQIVSSERMYYIPFRTPEFPLRVTVARGQTEETSEVRDQSDDVAKEWWIAELSKVPVPEIRARLATLRQDVLALTPIPDELIEEIRAAILPLTILPSLATEPLADQQTGRLFKLASNPATVKLAPMPSTLQQPEPDRDINATALRPTQAFHAAALRSS